MPTWNDLEAEVLRLEGLLENALHRASSAELAMSRWRAIAGDLLDAVHDATKKLDVIEERAKAL